MLLSIKKTRNMDPDLKPTYKKISVGIAAALVMMFGDRLGVEQAQLDQVVYLMIALIVAIGSQDFGKESKKLELQIERERQPASRRRKAARVATKRKEETDNDGN